MKKLTNNQRQVLLSGILGDGSLRKGRGYFSCIHKEYMELKKNLLGEIALLVEKKQNSGYKKDAFIYSLYTIKHPEILEMETYSIEKILSELDELGIALWLADDGSRHKKNNFYNLNTHAINRDIEENIIIPFFNKINIFPKITTETKKDGRCFSYLYIPKWQGAMELSKMLRKLNLKCYDYKIMPFEIEELYFKLKDTKEFKNASNYQKTNIIKKELGISHNSFLHKNIKSVEMVYTNSALI
jgi:hypothetical protein